MSTAQVPEVNSIFLATMAGAMIVLTGALYAAVFAIAQITNSVKLARLSYLFYCLLAVSVLVLARTLDFTGVWHWIAAVMLAGYFVAPWAIWKLRVGTHDATAGRDKESGDKGAGESDAVETSPRNFS